MSRKRGSQPLPNRLQQHVPQSLHHRHPQLPEDFDDDVCFVQGPVFDRFVEKITNQEIYLRHYQQIKRELELSRENMKLAFTDYVVIGIIGVFLTIVPFIFVYGLLWITTSSLEVLTMAVFIFQLISCCCFVSGARKIVQHAKQNAQSEDASRFQGVVTAAVAGVHQDTKAAMKIRNQPSRQQAFETLMNKYQPVLEQCTVITHSAHKLAFDLCKVGVQQAGSYHNNLMLQLNYLYSISTKTDQVQTNIGSFETKRREIQRSIGIEQLKQQQTEFTLARLKTVAREERKELKERLEKKETILQEHLNEVQDALKNIAREEDQEWVMCSQDDID